ncbi:MAG: hypothetical protein Q7S65_00330 [Nanoarchaeota archaeon]|nr:hypothetical protein [Nanoarchaeota archaeon]
MELKPFAKGKRGIVHLARYKGETIVVKAKNPRSDVDRLFNEAEMLKKLNLHGIGPAFKFFKDGKVGMEYIKGKTFEEWMLKQRKAPILKSLTILLEQMYLFDTLGIVKEEMHHPTKHVIMRGSHPVLIDFERCRYSEKPHNVPQFLQYLSNGRLAPLYASKKITFPRETCIALAKEYLEKRDLKRILKKLKLS